MSGGTETPGGRGIVAPSIFLRTLMLVLFVNWAKVKMSGRSRYDPPYRQNYARRNALCAKTTNRVVGSLKSLLYVHKA